MKHTHGGLLILVKLQTSACNFTKINTPPWVFFTFFNLYKWYQIAQSTTYDKTPCFNNIFEIFWEVVIGWQTTSHTSLPHLHKDRFFCESLALVMGCAISARPFNRFHRLFLILFIFRTVTNTIICLFYHKN